METLTVVNISEAKKRKPNWRKDECLLLTALVNERKPTIEGKFSSSLTSAMKQEAWETITATINSTSSHHRTKEEVEKKWKNMKATSRKNFSDFNSQSVATGGGPPPTPLSPVSDAVVDVIGRDNVTLTGIHDGADSTLLQLLNSQSVSHGNEIMVVADVHPPPPGVEMSPTHHAHCVTSHPSSSTASSRSTDSLLKEKMILELEILRLKKKYLEMKIKKMEE